MKKIVVYIVLLFSLFVGCVDHQSDDWASSVIVRGARIQCVGRAAEENTQFQAGNVVSFFSQGGIEAENVRLTYQDGIWEHGGVLKWNTSGEAATYTAYYPSFESGDWEYYDEDGFLKDIVYADGEVSLGMSIELNFQHLFSKIIFEVDEKLNEQIQSITFTPSVQVESIDPLTHEVTLTGAPASPIQIEKQSETYSFFVPSADEVTIDIQITTSEGKQISSTTSSQSYESGYRYTYYLAPEERKPGIYTVEDFIAFTHLINGMSYQGKSLDEFGEEVNGRMTYYLRDDLQFTEETSKEVQPIGINSGKRFDDCFDGRGHTISGLQIGLGNTTAYNGIFAYVQASGRIENLNVENCSYMNTTNSQTKYVGMIAGWNYGTIIRCNVKSCRIEDNKLGRAGGIVCNNFGYIFNCLVDNVQFIGDAMCSGGLCYGNEESCETVNCCVVQCNFIGNEKSGGLCYNMASRSSLLNCYVYSLDAENTNLGALLYKYSGGSMENCYCQEDSTLVPICEQASYYKGKIYTYDSDFTVTDKACSLLEALNKGVEEYQEEYPDYPLWRWQAGDGNIPFVLQTP